MRRSEQVKGFEDPLFSRVRRAQPAESDQDSPGKRNTVMVMTAAAILCVLGYFIFEGQQRLEQLNSSLTASQNQLSQVTEDLGASQGMIEGLEGGLAKSQVQLASQSKELGRYKGLYSGIKSEQTQQSRELQAISIEKADQSELNTLKQQATDLQFATTAVKEQVDVTQSEIAELNETSSRNRSDIENNRQILSQVGQKTNSTASELEVFRQSFERERYNFELQEKAGLMKVFSVALRLRDIDYKKQRYELEIIAGTERIRRKNQNINEPIYFYVEGVEKPYEVLVTKLDKKFAVGHLSIPKS